MSIAKIKLDESTKLEFGVSITGASGVPQSRLVIEGKDFAVSYACKQTMNGVEADLANLKGVLPAGEYPVRLEIVIENKIYTPLQDTIVIEPGVEITSKPQAVVNVEESIKIEPVTVTAKTAPTTNMLAEQARVASAFAEVLGYYPSLGERPQQVVENALAKAGKISPKTQRAVNQMISLANEVGLSIGTQK